MAKIKDAGTAEIIRSTQKDDNILHYLRSSVTDIVQSAIGPHFWIRWRHLLDISADIAYFVITTCSDLQTVGEEYVNIIQTDHTLRRLPSKLRRGLMIALQVCAPYLLQSALKKFEYLLQHSSSLPIKPANRRFFQDILPLVRKSVYVLHRLHLAFFYLNGLFHHLGKRIAGIRYVQITSEQGNSSTNNSFRILGYLSFLQIFISMGLYTYYAVVAIRDKNSLAGLIGKSSEVAEQQVMAVQPKDKCPLCLAKRQTTTLTPCGHLYCWTCIMEWCHEKPECPLCRDQFEPQQLIVLQNYGPR